MSTFLQRVRDRNLVNILSTIDVSVTRGFTIDTINWSWWPKQWLFIRWRKINFMTQTTWTIRWCHLRVFQRDREVFIRFQRAKKMAILQHVFPPNIYLPGSTRKPTAERHVTLKEKRIKIYLPFQRNKGVPLVTCIFKLSAIVDIIINFIAI